MVEVSATSILNRKSEKVREKSCEKRVVKKRVVEKEKKQKEYEKSERELERMLNVCCSCCPSMDGL